MQTGQHVGELGGRKLTGFSEAPTVVVLGNSLHFLQNDCFQPNRSHLLRGDVVVFEVEQGVRA